MYKKLRTIVTAMVIFAMVAMPFGSFNINYAPKALAAGFSGGGTGVSGDPYEIDNCTQLTEVNNDLTAYYELINDMSCTASAAIIGTSSNQFTGNFNGNNRIITLAISTSSDFVGLFAVLNGATVMNLHLDGYVTAIENNYVASLAGVAVHNNNIANIINYATVTGYSSVGGLVGTMSGDSNIVNNIVNSGTINAPGGYSGGVIGHTIGNANTYSQMYNTATVAGTNFMGGLIGRLDARDGIGTNVVTESANTGPLVANGNYAGGIVSYMTESATVLSKVENRGDITTQGGYAGGLVGYMNGGSIANSFNAGKITTNYQSGGLVGQLFGSTGSISNCYNRGTVIAQYDWSTYHLGGLIGWKGTTGFTISNSFNVGPVIPKQPYYYWGGIWGIDQYADVNGDPPFMPSGLSSNYFDIARTGHPECGFDNFGAPVMPISGSCEGVNSDWSNNDYFKNNSTNAPLNTWDFATTWGTVVNGYPELLAIAGDEIAVDDIPSLPGAPTGLGLSDRGEDYINIVWTAPEVDGYSTVTNYYVEYSLTGTGDWAAFSMGGPYNYYNAGYLTAGTEYFFRVKAVNVAGEGDYSDITSFTTLTAPPVEDVSDCEELQNITDMRGTYTLTGNIDCSATSISDPDDPNYNANLYNDGFGFTPLGWNDSTYFTGTFNGNGYTIDGLTINRPDDDYVGMFYGQDSYKTVKNLNLTNVNITGYDYVGAVTGENDGKIINVHVTGAVSGSDEVGGLVGYNDGRLANSSFSGTVHGESETGGLVGYNDSYISSSSSTGTVYGGEYNGGLVGYNDSSIGFSYSNSTVDNGGDSGEYNGGLAGYNYGYVFDSYATGSVYGSNYNGGFIGYNDDCMSNVYSTGSVTSPGEAWNGGLVGYDDDGGCTDNSFWDTETSGMSYSDGPETGKTTAEMTDIATFTDTDNSTGLDDAWDFTGLWQMDESNSSYPHLVWQEMAGGGTAEFPWQITSVHQLQYLDYPSEDSGMLAGNIDAAETVTWNDGEGFTPIGTYGNRYFEGNFDGNDNTINDLYVNRPDENGPSGLFYDVYDSTIKDLTLSGGSVTGKNFVGALAGYTENTTIDNVESDLTVTGVYNEGSDEGGQRVGGLVGFSNEDTSISDSAAMGDVTGHMEVGGLVGWADYGTSIARSYATGDVYQTGDYCAGGLVGENYGDITASFATGDVNGTNYVGGLTGYNIANITNTYARGAANGSGNYVGGLVGYNDDEIISSYATGMVTGGTSYGGLVGNNNYYVSNSYWDTETTGQAYSSGSDETVYGKTTAEMKTQANYQPGNEDDWDFTDIWNIDAIAQEVNDGYPFFRWQIPDDLTTPVFTPLPGSESTINIEEGQTILTNPYLIKVRPTDEGGIDRVEFYVDDILICTATTPDEDGVYTCAWDTSKYHSLISVLAYDLSGNESEILSRTTTVDPSLYETTTSLVIPAGSILPVTGKD